MNLTPTTLAAALDSTNLRLDAPASDIVALCHEAAKHRFACVMIYPASVPLAARVLAGSGIKIGTVIGFPSGRFSTEAKAAEIDAASAAGAHEVDIVMNYAALRDGDFDMVDRELRSLTQRAHGHGQLVKVIVETCYLDEDQHLIAELTGFPEAKPLGRDFHGLLKGGLEGRGGGGHRTGAANCQC